MRGNAENAKIRGAERGTRFSFTSVNLLARGIRRGGEWAGAGEFREISSTPVAYRGVTRIARGE